MREIANKILTEDEIQMIHIEQLNLLQKQNKQLNKIDYYEKNNDKSESDESDDSDSLFKDDDDDDNEILNKLKLIRLSKIKQEQKYQQQLNNQNNLIDELITLIEEQIKIMKQERRYGRMNQALSNIYKLSQKQMNLLKENSI